MTSLPRSAMMKRPKRRRQEMNGLRSCRSLTARQKLSKQSPHLPSARASLEPAFGNIPMRKTSFSPSPLVSIIHQTGSHARRNLDNSHFVEMPSDGGNGDAKAFLRRARYSGLPNLP